MIRTQSQAIIVATVSRVFVEIETVCSLSNRFDRITDRVQNFHWLCSHLASEQVDGVWLRVPNDGCSGATPARCRTTARLSVVESPGASKQMSCCRDGPGHWRGMPEERGPVSKQRQQGGPLHPRTPREVICALGSPPPQTPGWKAVEVIWFLVQHRYKDRKPRPRMEMITV